MKTILQLELAMISLALATLQSTAATLAPNATGRHLIAFAAFGANSTGRPGGISLMRDDNTALRQLTRFPDVDGTWSNDPRKPLPDVRHRRSRWQPGVESRRRSHCAALSASAVARDQTSRWSPRSGWANPKNPQRPRPTSSARAVHQPCHVDHRSRNRELHRGSLRRSFHNGPAAKLLSRAFSIRHCDVDFASVWEQTAGFGANSVCYRGPSIFLTRVTYQPLVKRAKGV